MVLSPRQIADFGEGHFDTIQVEVTSRKLFADRGVPIPSPVCSTTTTHWHTIAPEEEIETVLDALHRAFNSPVAAATDGFIEQWLGTNRFCSLHVHVGNNEEDLPLQTVKNVISLHTAFEHVIGSMHSKPRIGGTALALEALNALDHEQGDGAGREEEFRSFPIPLTPDDVPNVPLTGFHIARACFQRASRAGCVRFAHGGFPRSHPSYAGYQRSRPLFPLKETAVSLRCLIDNGSEQVSHKMIEFRQHGPATIASETLPWINFASFLVRYAHENSVEKVLGVCTHAAEDPTLTLEDFLGFLPMDENRMLYYLDRVDDPALGSEMFLHHTAAHAEVEAAFGEYNGPLRRVVLELIDGREAQYDHTVVRKAMRDKFDAGGYGQFIDVHAPDLDEEIKVKLTIGWENL